MSALTKDLKHLVKAAEEASPKEGRFRQKIHLTPPVGWLNDPNGLCEYQGIFHAFFQYAPFNVDGGVKMWGHSVSRDLIHWEYKDAPLVPDQPFDCGGVYSGCALTEGGVMSLYYTGNVKKEDGEYDYILNGREGNTVLTESRDGEHFGPKKLLMTNRDYPSDLTCHVRDPKVWKADGRYYMVQGARTKEDQGEVLVFSSGDGLSWKLEERIRSRKPFGYMWECPDYFLVGDRPVLSASVQGLEGEEWQNVYQSGYFELEGTVPGTEWTGDYHLWDYGFDFYAPQSFETEDGRRILIGWMGMPDCREYGNEKTRAEGWQHCFTFPRELYEKGGKICQRPARELASIWKKEREAKDRISCKTAEVFKARISGIWEGRFAARIGGGLYLEYEAGRFQIRFADQEISGGRTRRSAEVSRLESVEILGDVSSLEIFVNGGETVFSTRYYPEEYSVEIEAPGAKIKLCEN